MARFAFSLGGWRNGLQDGSGVYTWAVGGSHDDKWGAIGTISEECEY